MNFLVKILYVIYSPILVIIYWKNSLKSLDDIHGDLILEQN